MRAQHDEFRFSAQTDVRFRDIDIGGHAHHSQALVYMEEGRSAYWREVTGRGDPSEVDFILAEARVRFRRRVLYPDRLTVQVRVGTLGRKHFVMEYRVHSGSGELLVSGETTLMAFDYGAGRTKPLDPEVRRAIEAFDGPFGGGAEPGSAGAV